MNDDAMRINRSSKAMRWRSASRVFRRSLRSRTIIPISPCPASCMVTAGDFDLAPPTVGMT